ncbi:MAG: hypothetical protein ACI9MC_002107, partial [Kiritimatiellia bacterium]
MHQRTKTPYSDVAQTFGRPMVDGPDTQSNQTLIDQMGPQGGEQSTLSLLDAAEHQLGGDSLTDPFQQTGPESMRDLVMRESSARESTREMTSKIDDIVIGKDEAGPHTEQMADLFKSGFSRSKAEGALADGELLAEMCAMYGADFEQVRHNWRSHPGRHDDPCLVRESLVAGLIKNKLDPEATVQNDVLESEEMEAGKSLGMLLTYAMNGKLKKWIGKDEDRKKQATDWFEKLMPDVSVAENNGGQEQDEERGVELAGVDAAVASFTKWDDFEYNVIIVPGFTPRAGLEENMVENMNGERKTEEPELQRMSETWGDTIRLHPTAVERLTIAVADYRDGKAPFVLLTGANVWPKGSGIYEAIEMKKWLLQEGGIPADRIIVDAKAKHSTTNIRNAGRYMLDHGMKGKGLITTSGGQNFYFGHNILSSYAFRALGDMGVAPNL